MVVALDGPVITKTNSACGFRAALVATALLAMLCSDRAEAVTANSLRSHVCRVTNQVGGSTNLGSGTLIHRSEDGREGLVLTCAHLFREGTGAVVVEFADGQNHRATLIDVDSQADLAALAIAHPVGMPAPVSFEISMGTDLYACGYGPQGLYRCAIGSKVGQAESAGQVSLLIDDSVRSGDSGGGVFDARGRLVAVIWGESQGVTYASFGTPLRSFVSRVLGRRTASMIHYCPNGVCRRRPEHTAPTTEGGGQSTLRWRELQKQLDELRRQKQDRGDYVLRSELPSFGQFASTEEVRRLESETNNRHANLLEQVEALSGRGAGRALGKAAAGLLGLSGPAGWAIVAASGVGGWLLGRRMKRKLRGARGRRRGRFRGRDQMLRR